MQRLIFTDPHELRVQRQFGSERRRRDVQLAFFLPNPRELHVQRQFGVVWRRDVEWSVFPDYHELRVQRQFGLLRRRNRKLGLLKTEAP